MSWKPSDLPDLSGRTAIVTGANSGIGYYCALELARHGADVTLACRNVGKAEAAVDKIRRASPGADVRVGELDVASLDSVRAFAESWTQPLDLLINNAGIMAPLHRRTTVDGFELQMGTNYLGPFALTGLLLPALLSAPAARVVAVSSLAHFAAGLDRANVNADVLNSVTRYNPQVSYSNTKLADLLFARELQRRAAGTALTSTAAHPGLSSTGLVSSPDGLAGNRAVRAVLPTAYKIIGQSSAAGANPLLYAAVVAEPGSYTGPRYLGGWRGPAAPARISKDARDDGLAERLWELSSELTDVSYDWDARL